MTCSGQRWRSKTTTDHTGNIIAEGDTVHIVGKITACRISPKQLLSELSKISQNKPEGTTLNLFANQVEFYQGDTLPQLFRRPIFSNQGIRDFTLASGPGRRSGSMVTGKGA